MASLGRDGSAALRRLELLELQRGRRLSPYEPLAAEYICGGKDRHARLAPKLRGVNLGGWLVLEPWVTPSLFYQFEGKPPQQTAMDHYTFCSILGPREGNRQLREHWQKWVTEGDLRALVDQGINTLRIPVGDWMWQPYYPYTGFAQTSPEEGVSNPSRLPCLCRCTAGAVDELQRLLRTCDRLGLRVLIDMHGSAFTSYHRSVAHGGSCSRMHSLFHLVHRRPSLTKWLRQLWPCCQRDVGGKWAVICTLADPQCGMAGGFRPFYDDVLSDQLEQHTDDRAGKLGVTRMGLSEVVG